MALGKLCGWVIDMNVGADTLVSFTRARMPSTCALWVMTLSGSMMVGGPHGREGSEPSYQLLSKDPGSSQAAVTLTEALPSGDLPHQHPKAHPLLLFFYFYHSFPLVWRLVSATAGLSQMNECSGLKIHPEVLIFYKLFLEKISNPAC